MAPYTVAVTDDHVLIRNGLATLINSFDEFRVLFQAKNGQELIDAISVKGVPRIVLLDINMPKKDGYETMVWLKEHHPDINVLALSMYDTETAIIRMMKNGAKGYILKDAEPLQLKEALLAIVEKGYYYSELVTGRLINSLNKINDIGAAGYLALNEREIEFLKLICTELNLKEIAEKLFVSPRTVDNYRDNLFLKLNVKTRVGLVIYAIKSGLVTV